MAFSANSAPLKIWQFVEATPLLSLVLLLPALWMLPPVPIDETRYLAVAWEMRRDFEYLVPHLNGQWYADKPPLLFWLINLGWWFTGVYAWSARLVTLLFSAVSLILLGRICLALKMGQQGARIAQWVLAGSIYFALFANAIMFDVLLTSCVLAALLGLLQIEAALPRRGILLMGTAIGLGILAKGPVMLLDMGFAVLLAPWWSASVRGRWRSFAGSIGCALLLGIGLGLLWAIPAALHGGPDYARALFLHQTLDRMTSSFAHARPVWWYAIVLPIMLLPWTLSVRPSRDTASFLLQDKACRFALAWSLPAVAIFCLINGKQPHYLLPLLPAFAIAASALLTKGQGVIASKLFASLMLTGGIALVALPWMVARDDLPAAYGDVAPIWGVMICVVAGGLFFLKKAYQSVAVLTLSALLTQDLAQFALVRPISEQNDVTAVALMIGQAQMRGQAVAHIGWHHGLYEFSGGLMTPLPMIQPDEIRVWCEQHPDGLVVAMDGDLQLDAAPIYSSPFRDARASVWRAIDAAHAKIVDIRKHH